MSRKININKYRGNTHFSVTITDSYNQEHHLGYYNDLSPEIMSEIEADAEMLWQNEVKKPENLLNKAITNCIEIDKRSGILKGNSDGLD